MKEKFPHSNHLTGVSVGSFGISKGNITGRKKTKQNNNNNPESMHLTTTTSRDREVAQSLLSITSEWGLGREARTASPFLRVRTRLECPENNLRELM